MREASTERCVLIIGSLPERPFLLEETVRITREMGMQLTLLDSPQHREHSLSHISDDRFIPVAPADLTHTGIASVTNSVNEYASRHKLVFEAVYTALDIYVELAAELAQKNGAGGNTRSAVQKAVLKSLMRAGLADNPDITTAYRVARSESEALAAYRDIEGRRFVAKPIRGAGSRGVITGIDSEERMRAAWRNVRSFLDTWRSMPNGRSYALYDMKEVLIENQLEGAEVDVELVLQDGDIRFAAVADNSHGAVSFDVETSSTYPSQLPEKIQQEIIRDACRALGLLNLTAGNFHVEMIYTDQGAKIVEVNARMGGAFVWEAIKAVYGVSLVELGLKALFGSPLRKISAVPRGVLEARFLIPKASGIIEKIDGVKNLSRMPGFEDMRLWKRVGDEVAAPEHDPSDYLGFALYKGRTVNEAVQRAADALQDVSFWIRDISGELIESKGNYLHRTIDSRKEDQIPGP